MSSEPVNVPSTEEDIQNNQINVRVAKVLNEREVAFNFGENAGIEEGMRFAIIDILGEPIKDPVTGEILGEVSPREKIRVEIVEVAEKFSIGRTYHYRRVNEGGTGFGIRSGLRDFASAATEARVVTYPYTFRKGEGAKEHFKKISEIESVVKVGDHAIEVDDEEANAPD